ncbi:60S ribosomal protein L18a-like protein isoform X2 [Mangifera indica]|uniref:60S ribosomal protein L18a-like protein isoform X2 n=1 Tax=Mangifera indica TaxID=29780 RepID=UPI001CFA3F8D|nr:60S ribosomal protein L18a-like protein isoform X2 [Mangifera indica]
MSEEGKGNGGTGNVQYQNYYGTFQGVANYYPPYQPPLPHTAIGYPQPSRPHGSVRSTPLFAAGYQTISGYDITEGTPVRERCLPCCGLGMGWFLFIVGFFFGGIPWYVGAFVALCVRVDDREKPGYVACAIAAILTMIALALGVAKGSHSWVDWHW